MSIGFVDLNVLANANNSFPNLEDWSTRYYSTVALNHVVDLTELGEQMKKKKAPKVDVTIPEPKENKDGKIKVLNRLTIKVSDPSLLHKLFQSKSNMLKMFDILAVMPMDQSSLQLAITMNDIDLICVDCQTKPTWKLLRKIYKTAVDNHKYFEFCYGPGLSDSSTLKNAIYMTHTFYSVGRSKNIIVSSGTSDPFFLRSPYEVIYLCFLYGLDENKARETITTNPSNLTIRAYKRRQGRACISVSGATS